ncbi:MAG TPA: toprim domain-containing protein [Candidatus Paceibacterota bacterium]|nr:type IIA DNA topoisomerase subunit B [Verrucomicrobiota bacterium]HOX02672.1 toprim domain-containing protein [Verrucomicrobiota bacterium]HRZ44387.1 toprim domain-containing protein [Candidatus Paceibacterota bacterium]HRZ93359.1 toprim domain-containing protein [Candidatus Paceibacterota bacterium]
MGDPRTQKYDESQIQTLSSIEHIRLRTGMYIGRIGDGTHYEDGAYILLKEIIDNAVDEFIMGCGKEIQIQIDSSRITVRDFGRGIPLGKVVDCVSRINTGAKYNDAVFQFSVGLNGVGTKAVNALSREFLVRSHRGGQFVEALFRQGRLRHEKRGADPAAPDGTLIQFEPDPEVFPKFEFRPELVERRLRHYSYLNTGLRLVCNGKVYLSRLGLLDLVMEDLATEGGDPLYPPLHYTSRTLEFCFTHSLNRSGETCFSFVNGQFTADGGTHLSAFREGLLKAINEHSQGKFEGDDVREGLVGAVAIRLREPVFESQTKNKLGNTEIRTDLVNQVRTELLRFLHAHRDIAAQIVARVEDTRQLRKELLQVRKLARERAKAISLRIPQLKDCKQHFDAKRGRGQGTMLFICEGQSAAGSITSCRDVDSQAVFVLKGKPLNVWDLPRDIMYKNDELYHLMQSLNLESSIAGLRYEKVILATDADVDGLHIRNLMIAYFFRFFDALVREGHLFILDTPLFRVRNKHQTIYCYSEAERNQATQTLGGSPEITRFKGLGEISPAEFKQFIGPDMRLSQVEFAPRPEAAGILGFYLGKNTPERKTYIMNHLVVPALD